ncbi:hypothetical protein [Sphingomonas faeni]|uniref:hypothetical protein n=1 Tax=Sphingomonas faeni TaxID=185950 RepID=UPI002412F28E|nr:hypothetical protein [Sphingomonas faeni]
MRRWITFGIMVVGVVLIAGLAIMLPNSAAGKGENGTFVNDYCGTITLTDGEMLLNGQRKIRYTVAQDADGPYILPQVYVGAVPDIGFDVDGTRSILKLRLDRLPAPTRIVLHEGLTPYVFTRHAPSLR